MNQHSPTKQQVKFWLPKTTVAYLDAISQKTGYNRTELILKAIRMAGLQTLPPKD